MRLSNKLKRLFSFERLLWWAATLLMAAVFLVIGLTAPSIKGFERKENTEIVQQTSSAVEPSEEVLVSDDTESDSGKVSLNTATKEQLMTISGIGEAFAQRIIDYREENGQFTDLTQLMNIDGIGEKRYQKWSPYLTLD